MALSKVLSPAFISKERVAALKDLSPGDHIHTPQGKTEYGLRRHMIVEQVDLEKQRVKVIHYNNKCKDKAKPLQQVIQTWECFDFERLKIERMVYNPKDRFPEREIVTRARLAIGMRDADLPSVPSRFKLSFYSASYHFAVLCVTGKGMEKGQKQPKIYQKPGLVHDMTSLTPGDHICLPRGWGDYSGLRHMIVVEVDIVGCRIRGIHYHNRSTSKRSAKESGTVIETWEEIDCKKHKICKYEYDPRDTLSAEITLRNANGCVSKTSFHLKGVLPPREKILQSSSLFFAKWCKTGFGWAFTDILSYEMPTEADRDTLSMAPVESIREIQEGDHIACEALPDGYHLAGKDDFKGLTHGIARFINFEKGQISAIFYNVNSGGFDYVTEGVWSLPDQKIYRCEYGESLKGRMSLDRAIRHLGSNRHDLGLIVPDISNCPDLTLMGLFFIRWCKTGKGWGNSTISRERMTSMDDLRPGDHLELERFQGLDSHHAVVESVQFSPVKQVTIIHPTLIEAKTCKIERKSISDKQNNLDFASGNIFKVKYDKNDCLDAEHVIERAVSLVGENGYTVLKENCEHFARWCKTGNEKGFQVTEVKKQCHKWVMEWLVPMASKLPTPLVAQSVAEMFEASMSSLESCSIFALTADVLSAAIIIHKEVNGYRQFRDEQDQLLQRKLIKTKERDNNVLKKKCVAITRVVGMLIGMVIGDVVEKYIPVPLIGGLVSVELTGVGDFLGHVLGHVIAPIVIKLKDKFETANFGNSWKARLDPLPYEAIEKLGPQRTSCREAVYVEHTEPPTDDTMDTLK